MVEAVDLESALKEFSEVGVVRLREVFSEEDAAPMREAPRRWTSGFHHRLGKQRSSRVENVEGDAVVLRCRSESGSHVELRDRNAAAERMGRGQRLGHRRRQMVAEGPMSVLDLSHRPREVSQVENADVLGKGRQLRAEPLLQLNRQTYNRRRQLARDSRVGECAVQTEPPQPRSGELGRDPAKVLGALSCQHIPQEVVVNDDRRHSGRS